MIVPEKFNPNPKKSSEAGSTFSTRKAILIILAFSLVILALYLSPLKQYWAEAPAFIERISRCRALSPIDFMLSAALLVCIGMPRLILCAVGGMLFGFYQGLFYSVTGSVLGCFIIFSAVRWGGQRFLIRHFPKLNRLTKPLERGGIPGIILAWQIPVRGINLILGLSSVKQSEYLIGTALGLIPQAIPFALIGKGVKQGSLEKSVAYMVTAVVLFAGFWLGLKLWNRKRINNLNNSYPCKEDSNS